MVTMQQAIPSSNRQPWLHSMTPGSSVASIQDILDLGVYLTTAVKCSKTGYGISSATIHECSWLLEREIGLFPNIRAYLLMGDVAIKAVNAIARRAGQARVIPAGSTYKIRGQPVFLPRSQGIPILSTSRAELLH